MASRARRDIQRNLLFILIALLALGVLIAVVGIVQGGEAIVLMPEQRAKFLERRADATGNGFADLLDACKALDGLGTVPICEDLLKTGKLNLQRPAAPQNPIEMSAALGRYLGANTFCPNDDPRFKEYMDKTELLLPPVLAALSKPFIHQSRVSIAEDPKQQTDNLESVGKLVRQLTAYALYQGTVTGDTAKAVGILQNALAVCRALEESASFDLRVGDPHRPPGREGFFKFGLSLSAGYPWAAIPVVAKYAADRNESLDMLLEMTRPTLENPADRSSLFMAYCMMLDDVMEGADAPSGMDFGKRLIMAIATRNARRDAQILAEQDAAIREALNGPLSDFREKIRKIAGKESFFGPKFMTLDMALMNTASVLEGRRIAAGLAVRLEAFRKDHGDYPEKLDELVPQYLSKIPAIPLRHMGGAGGGVPVPQSPPKEPADASSGPPPVYEKFKEGYVLSEGGASNMPDPRRGYSRGDDLSFSLDMRVIPPSVQVGAGLALPPSPPPR